MSLFGSSGVRAVVDRKLLCLSFELGLSLGAGNRSVVIGSDTRTSSDAMKFAFLSGLLASGARAYDAGVIPTPTLAYATRKFEAGAMVTASHNPPQYNGIKLWNPDGSAFDHKQRGKIEQVIAAKDFPLAPWQGMEKASTYTTAIEEHLDRILADFPAQLDGMKIAVDCGCGAASLVTPYLLEQMSAEVVRTNCNPGGNFPRGIEPVEENLTDLIKTVKDCGASLGIAHDGDADRLVAVDDKGRVVPGDKLLLLLAHQLKATKVVTTVDASMMIDEQGYKVIRTKVGDAFVSEELKNGGGDFGGEPSGSWIFPRVSFCPDGIYAAAMVAFLARRNRLSELVDGLPSYPIIRHSIPINDETLSGIGEQLIAKMKPLSVSYSDGVRLAFQQGWLLVRPSGTEPKIRLTVEAKTPEQAETLFNQGMQTVQRAMQAGEPL